MTIKIYYFVLFFGSQKYNYNVTATNGFKKIERFLIKLTGLNANKFCDSNVFISEKNI